MNWYEAGRRGIVALSAIWISGWLGAYILNEIDSIYIALVMGVLPPFLFYWIYIGLKK
jgi:hypothetical protein